MNPVWDKLLSAIAYIVPPFGPQVHRYIDATLSQMSRIH